MKKHEILLTVYFVFFLCFKSNAQDPSLSQFYSILMQTNPALTGSSVGNMGILGTQFAINGNYENVPNNGKYGNFVAAWQKHIPQIGGGIGVQFSRNVSGHNNLARSSLSLDYSYFIPLSKRVKVRFGLEASLINQGVDYSSVRYSSNTIDAFPSNFDGYASEKKTFMNYSSGLFFYSKKCYAGFATHNLLEPNQSFENDPNGPLNRRYTFQSGVEIKLSKSRRILNYFLPNVIFVKQNNFHQLRAGGYISKGRCNLGLMFKNEEKGLVKRNSITTLLGYARGRCFFGYSYDVNLKSNSLNTKGVHELTFRVDWSHLACRYTMRRGFVRIPIPLF